MATKVPVLLATLAVVLTGILPANAAEWYSADDRWAAYSLRDCRYVRDRYERRNCERFFRPEASKDDDIGAAIGIGIIGLTIGAIIAGAAAEQDKSAAKKERDRWLVYCSTKYRSFDPQSGTFLARDGLRYPCR